MRHHGGHDAPLQLRQRNLMEMKQIMDDQDILIIRFEKITGNARGQAKFLFAVDPQNDIRIADVDG
ncbi:hypothetical protein SDC9_118651 [bioreactor metagenome]|uniref:Uncharacterized protein n=1 Tax=bioreactor metagenome TaxID=1076179 RepID=A0A645C400_9ZZZZ